MTPGKARPPEPGPAVGGWEIVHLFVLSSFAIAQPVFAVLRGSPTFFVTRRAETADLVILTAALLLIPPAVAAAAVMAVRTLSPRAAVMFHRTLVGILFGLIVLPLGWRLASLGAPAAVTVATLSGVAASLLYHRVAGARQFLSLASVAPVAFAVLFLATPPISRLVSPGGGPGQAAAQPAARAPIVFVIFDEFPLTSLLDAEGGIDVERFPNFARLAAASHWFPNAVTTSDSTFLAIPSALSGKAPVLDTVPTAADHPRNLFTLLSGLYDIHAVEPFTLMCDPGICEVPVVGAPPLGERVVSLVRTSGAIYPRILLPQVYEHRAAAAEDLFGEFVNAPQELDLPELTKEEFDDRRRAAVAQEMGQDQMALFRAFISSIEPGERRLWFAHVFLPHSPYIHLPSGHTYPDAGIPGRRVNRWIDPWLSVQGYQRHLLQLKRLDGEIGALIDHLRSRGMFDETLLVVMADHGASYRVGEEQRQVTETNRYEIGLVPLFIKAPQQRRGEVHALGVSILDVLPGVADLLGIDVPWETDGRSPFSGESRDSFVLLSITGDEIPLTDPAGGRREGGRRIARLFGMGVGPFDLFAFGAHAGLVGTPVGDLGVRGPSPVTARIDEPETFEEVDPSSGNLPAYLTADLGGVASGMHVAVALNGTVATVAPAYAVEGSSGKLSVVLPGHLFRNGANEVRLFAVTGTGDARTIRTIAVR